MSHFTESTIKQAAIDWQEETQMVFTVNRRHVVQESLAKRGASQSRKPLGSKTEVRTLARLRDKLSLPKLMRGEVRVKL